MSSEQKDMMAVRIAETVLEDLGKVMDPTFDKPCFPSARVWAASDHARVYTGHGGEHLRVTRDGKVARSKTNMTWGQYLDAVESGDHACDLLPEDAEE